MRNIDFKYELDTPMSKTILITGASRGIGRAVAVRFAREGFDIILTYKSNREAAEEAASLCMDAGAKSVMILQADGTDFNSIDVIIDTVERSDVKLDCIVMNTGITHRGSFEELTIEDWNRVMTANVSYPLFLLQRLLPFTKEEASVIFTGSMMAVQPHGMSLPYGVTKSAVHSLVKNLVKHLENYKIRVNGIAPGFIDTEWQKAKPKEIRENIERKIALHRFALPEEVAGAYYFLYKNKYINGEIIEVSGGYCYK